MIAIKNMKMPSCCGECPMTYKDYVGYRICPIIGKNIDYGYSDDIHPDCPLVEIVTCKDCKHWKFDENKSILCGYCSDLETETNEDFYCADAERNEKTSRAEELRKITEAAYEGNEVETGEQNNDSWC